MCRVAIAADGRLLVAFRELFSMNADGVIAQRPDVTTTTSLRNVVAIHRRARIACSSNRMTSAVTIRTGGCSEETILNERLAVQTTSAQELYDQMLKLYPDWGNRGALWSSVRAVKT